MVTRRRWKAWAAQRTWHQGVVESGPLRYELDHELGVMVCVTRPAYAECQGPDDQFCGRCRFSVHGCDGAPSRAEYLADLSL